MSLPFLLGLGLSLSRYSGLRLIQHRPILSIKEFSNLERKQKVGLSRINNRINIVHTYSFTL